MTVHKRIQQLLGLKPVTSQHTPNEAILLQKYASGRKTLVEIGVAEGGSALLLRQSAAPEAHLYLIDPYISGRIPGLNSHEIIAKRYVQQSSNGTVHWLKDFSFNVAKGWTTPIDFLFIDGDHHYEAVAQDWQDWHPFVVPGGVVIFHDANHLDWGPGKLVQELFRQSHHADWRIVDEADTAVVVQRY